MATATGKLEVIGDPSSLDLFCFVIALGGTSHHAKEYGLWGARLTKTSAMPFFFSGDEGGRGEGVDV